MASSLHPGLRVVGVIPARYDSERLPGKVLLPICGKPMIHVVYERARLCPLLDELWVATDSERVQECCVQNCIPVLMTLRTHRSGTERILEVMEKIPGGGSGNAVDVNAVYVNIQGDEPMITPRHVRLLIEPFLDSTTRDSTTRGSTTGDSTTSAHPGVQVTTLKTPLDPAEAANPNVVKVVTNLRGEAVYFSRAPIPYPRNAASHPGFYKHLGLYAYTRGALERYRALPASPLEETERLEQLRFVEHGIPIQVAETAEDTIGVDTREDWAAVTKYFEALPAGGGTSGG
jgi:3-deoxy-manno-octulosonate cytidylyltransferase (CMP-KDO synthetase)